MQVRRFDKKTAVRSHSGTILASEFVPEGCSPPFKSAWGYIDDGGALETHAHPSEEIYVVIEGHGEMVVGDETQSVSGGDVILIPGGSPHSLRHLGEGPLLWAALWWTSERL